jgi:putative transposase
LEDQRPLTTRPAPQNKLSKVEVQAILDVANAPEYASLPPSQIVPKLADKWLYHGSEPSFYRVLRAHDQVHHRGRSRVVVKRAAPVSYLTTGPN